MAVTSVPEGYWQREASHYPKPLSPLSSSILLPACNDAFRKVFSEYGLLLDGIEFREFGGWVYNRMVPMGGKDRKAPPKPLFWLLVRTVPEIRQRLKTQNRALRDDVGMSEINLWYDVWKGDQAAKVAEFRAIDTASLDDTALLAHFEKAAEFTVSSFERHFRLTPPGLVLADLAFYCEEHLGWKDVEVFRLMIGRSDASTAPARALSALTGMAAANPTVRAALNRGAAIDEVRRIDPAFGAAFDEYLDTFGYRALRYEIADPSLHEDPGVTLGLVRDQLSRGYDPDAERAQQSGAREAALGEARAKLSGAALAEFERLRERAERYYPVREDNEFYTVSAPLAVLREASLAAGDRLVGRGQMESPGDIYWLRLSEVRPAFTSGRDQRGLVAARKAEREEVLANPGPASYGTPPGPPPPFDVLPGPAAQATKSVFWLTQRVFEEESSQRKQSNALSLNGVAASPGEVTGPARVILGEDDFDRIEPGDVLVCPITSPVWSVLFPSITALVTDSGGILSHPAIIAREYCIPAVVATGNATELLRDGQTVRVDGTAGTVTVVG